MLNSMAEQGKKEKHEEEVAFAKFSTWCDDTSAEKTNLIENASLEMKRLAAFIEKSKADAEALANSIAALDASIADLTSQKEAEQAERAKAKKDFLAVQTDYEESIDALGRAISTVKAQMFDRKQAADSLLQVKMMSTTEKEKVMALLNQPAHGEAANAYEGQSGGIVDMLETLETKFVEELRAAQKENAEAAHQSNLMVQSLTDQIDAATKQMNTEVAQRHKKLEDAGKAESELADTTAAHDSDVKYLSDLKAECAMKSKDFENRQKLRGEEIEAIGKATEVLSSGAVSGNADTYLPSFVQKGVRSFIQVKRQVNGDKKQKLVEFLQRKGQDSKPIMLLAARVSETGPFDKVTKMIEELITKLKEEATAEAEEHGFCTSELAGNKMTREDKTAKSDELRSQIDALKADIAEASAKVLELEGAVKDSDKAVAEAVAQRAAEKAKNTQTVKDAKVAQEAVSQALTVLKEFYAKASTATSLVQGPAEDAPATFDKPYTGMQGSSTGVVGMIEVIQSDFVRLETETASEEATASREHQQFLDDSAEDKAVKEAEIAHLNKRRAKNTSNMNSATKELNVTQEELKAAMDYFDVLKPRCLPDPVSWEERKAKREEEIASLREALTILDQ